MRPFISPLERAVKQNFRAAGPWGASTSGCRPARLRQIVPPRHYSSIPPTQQQQQQQQQQDSTSSQDSPSTSASTSTTDSSDTTNTASSSRRPQSASSGSASYSGNPFAPHFQRLQSTLASQRAHYEPKIRSELSRLGQKWNIYSGYDQIESAKQRVVDAEERLASLRKLQADARRRYLSTVDQRSISQKTINDLLQRKASWSDDDLIKYTSLLRSEHSEARSEDAAREEFDRAEREVGRAWDDVVKTTLERYHDEQVWSDRVRNVSSYTQLAVVGLNVFIFMLAIILVEPYKRRKLAETFEKRLLKGEEQGRVTLSEVISKFDSTIETLSNDLNLIKENQKGLLTVAGVPAKEVQSQQDRDTEKESQGEEYSQARQSLTTAEDHLDGRDLLNPKVLWAQAKKQTRFLTHPNSKQEKQKRDEFLVASGIGASVAVIGLTLIKLLLGA
ncbi:unnamed protein product [Sympodiomycopsis kandeliae]